MQLYEVANNTPHRTTVQLLAGKDEQQCLV